uniref:Truncated ribosomal protein L16 n=1 Tax=Gnetum montanum TaxID=3381 RepID=D2DWK7_9SPER|nr:truncated ribosomal protein L16 [Gnetum montanum]
MEKHQLMYFAKK